MTETVNTLPNQNYNQETIPQQNVINSLNTSNNTSRKHTPTQSQTQNSANKTNFALDVNNILDKIKINGNNMQLEKNSKIKKDEYKKIVKEKNYSRSIDTNIPKTKNNVGPFSNVTNFQITNGNSNLGNISLFQKKKN